MPQRNVTITADQEAFVKAALTSGQYRDENELFQAALHLLEQEEAARHAGNDNSYRRIAQGVEDIKAGRYTEISDPDSLDDYFADLRSSRTQR